MVCHLPNLLPYVDFERDLDVIGKVAELTHANGVRLAVETCGYPEGEHAFLPDAELVIRIVETLDLPDVGINLVRAFRTESRSDPFPFRPAAIGVCPRTRFPRTG